MVDRHKHSCLHSIEKWNGFFFIKTSLKALGLRIQLGHSIGEVCHNPHPAFGDDFVVIDVNGIHNVGLDFCDCGTPQPRFVQLLRFRWWPATTSNPKSAATFRVLKHFQLLSFESKVSAFEFYHSLARETDNTGTKPPKDRYKAFMIMVHQYRYIKMLKHGGRGHHASGALGTKLGECAVGCPPCPHPGVNLPEDWKDAPARLQFLYCLFLAIDANFRLKRRMVSTDNADPSLVDGGAYFVRELPFKAFLDEFGKKIEQKPSTCSNHNAVNAEPSEKQGFTTSGVGSVDCARHDMKRPNGVGDLQKGERYVNMDYLFISTLQHSADIVELVVSYDIACQWSRNIWDRMAIYSHSIRVDHTGQKNYHFLIPKFHLPAHIKACQTVFSFNFNRHVGRTDGEATERGWSHINPVATSTREMGPGSRRYMIDDHLGAWNWKKSTLMGVSFLRKIKEAVAESNDRHHLHEQFTSGLLETISPDTLGRWEAEMEEWEVDHSKTNPFERTCNTITQTHVRLVLAEQDRRELESGSPYAMHEQVTGSQLIIMGIDLEDAQRRLAVDRQALGIHATDTQKAKILLQSNNLCRKIISWSTIQQLYIPNVHVLRSRDNDGRVNGQEELPEKMSLYLPSSMPQASLCDLRLRKMLRVPQANDALDDLRDGLRVRSFLYMDKDRFQRGQHANTRSRGIIARIEESFPILKPSDIRGLTDPEDQSQNRHVPGRVRSLRTVPSEGRRTLSWIWTRVGDASVLDAEVVEDSLRTEWCKSKARADRWHEEVQLLLEEMRRVKVFFESRALSWEDKLTDVEWSPLPREGDRHHDRGGDYPFTSQSADSATIEARRAYALQQAAMFRSIKQHCEHLWRYVEEYVRVGYGIVIPAEVEGNDGSLEEFI